MKKRMFSPAIIDSEKFLDMPLSAQALYFHLGMRADDDGFVNNPHRLARWIGCNADDLKLLIAKGFVIEFDSGVVVITHWRVNNYIRGDRYAETLYLEEKATLSIGKNGIYIQNIHFGIPDDIPVVDPVQYSIVQNRIEQYSIGQDNRPTDDFFQKLTDEQRQQCQQLIDSGMDASLLHYAVQKMRKYKADSWAYFITIINDYENNGIKTVEQAKAKSKKEKNNYANDIYVPPEW